MRLSLRDLTGTVLVAVIAGLYVTYLANGSALFITDPRGMAVSGLVLGWVACMAGGAAGWTAGSRTGNILLSIGGAATLGLGVAAIVLGTNTVVLAAFIVAIVAMWAVSLLRHAVGSVSATRTTGRRAHA